MALVRAVPLKDFRATALSTTGVATSVSSTVFPSAGDSLFAALHLTAISTARTLVFTIQAASSSGFAVLSTEITFALTSAVGSTWQRNATPSTDRQWRRANWTLSTAVSTGGSWNGLAWLGFRSV